MRIDINRQISRYLDFYSLATVVEFLNNPTVSVAGFGGFLVNRVPLFSLSAPRCLCRAIEDEPSDLPLIIMAESSVNEEFFDIDRQRLLAEIRDRVVEHRGTPEISSLERAVLWVSHTSLLERLLQNPEMFTLAFNGIRTMNVAGLCELMLLPCVVRT